MKNSIRKTLAAIVPTFLLCFHAFGLSAEENEMFSRLEKLNVSWHEAGPTSSESMPLGNGDIGLNVWAEPNGDICFYIGKTDSITESSPWPDGNSFGDEGLAKLGRVRISFNAPAEKDATFTQTLKLRESEIIIEQGMRKTRIWVDANNPVINVDVASPSKTGATLKIESWRTKEKDGVSPDVFEKPVNNRLLWYHQNKTKEPIVSSIIFGAVAEGKGLSAVGDNTLKSVEDARHFRFAVYPLTLMGAKSADEWRSAVNAVADKVSKMPYIKRYEAHKAWWEKFWTRSWIFVEGDEQAQYITRGYNLQRYITAAAGRGALPIKFNGSIFVVDRRDYKDKGDNKTADYRSWGVQYWFQNTRAMYWPRLMAGDFDIMMPLFKMYRNQVPLNTALTKKFYNHGGMYFAETAPFYGGFKRVAAPDSPGHWTGHYYLPMIELTMMALDYYDYTQNRDFVKNIILPIAIPATQFYLEHFGRDDNGKLLIYPCNAVEQFWKVRNPAPDIAGLKAVCTRLLALDKSILPESKRANFRKILEILPDLPRGTRDGLPVLLPYEGPQTAKAENHENPEVYAVYPFRLFGVGKPELQMVVDTFNRRASWNQGCWSQSPVQAAMLGQTKQALDYVAFCFSPKNTEFKFPAFWSRGFDYAPDQDNGGNGEQGLQRMVMYPEGKRLIMLPAFPENWSGFFRLAAPFKTTVTGKIENGKLVGVETFPKERKADIENASDLKGE